MKFIFIDSTIVLDRCLGIGEELAKKGHEVVFFIFNYKEIHERFGDRYNNIRFVYTSNKSGLRQIHKIYKLFLEKNIDVIHCMSVAGSVFIPALLYKKFLNKKIQLIIDYEDKQSISTTDAKESRKILAYEKLSFKYVDKIICASQKLADEYKLLNKNTFYLPFGIRLNPNFKKKIKKENFFLELCYLGNLKEIFKNQIDFLIDSALQIKNKDIIKFRLNIAGDGEHKEYFQNKVKELNLSNEVIFHGFILNENLNNFLSEMDILVFNIPDIPINRYRCPYKIFIYCSTGLPIISNKVGEIEKILSKYPNAIFFKPDNFESFKNAILKAKDINNSISMDFYTQNSWENRAIEYLKIIT
ncbi:glycosyltransferase [Candidatus Poribacteria bacterium]|nr:glycosyltransferase [Candidatus Poribacteria bacterium]